ncbi:Techylectin-5A, partial [Araneus ventricosus]
EDVNSTDESECGSLTYIEVSKNLISDVIKNFPTCSKPIEKDDKDNKDKDDKIVKDGKPKDCSDILASGRNKSGIYTIWTEESSTTRKQLRVYCDMETDDGGWTVIQRRGKFPVQQDFYRDWESYKNGFGNMSEEFWLGNENIRVLCREGCKIRFDLVDEKGEKGFALYQNFTLSSGNYRINIGGYSGNFGDAMRNHNNFEFSTKDKGRTKTAQLFQGGWWYEDKRLLCHLNGVYKPGADDLVNVFWWPWRQYKNLAGVEIKVRPK